MMFLHGHNAVATTRTVPLNVFSTVHSVMIEEDIDLVAGDLKGASWRRKVGAEQPYDSTLGEALKNARLPGPLGMENWAPLPKGFPQYNKLGSVRHVCELQGVMTL